MIRFNFCSIEDAVRFKAAFVRDVDWEHCNVQFAPDPTYAKTQGFFKQARIILWKRRSVKIKIKQSVLEL